VVAAVLVAPLSSTDQAQALGVPLLTDRSWLRVATTIAMFVTLAAAWNLTGGVAGYASFGNVVFFGIGAYTTGMLIWKAHVAALPTILAAMLLPALFAFAIGVPLLRLRGHYFAVATLGVSVAVGEVVNNVDFLGGGTGIFLPIVSGDLVFFYLMAGTATLSVLATWLVLRSRFGYGLRAIRENELAAAVMGVNTTRYKVAIFMLTAALTGLAGGVFAVWNSFINQENAFPISFNVQMILMAVLGGAGTLAGPVLGAVGLELLIQFLAGGGSSAVYAQIALGVVLVLVVVLVPGGLMGILLSRGHLSWRRLRRSLARTSA
jgi:branched-chain amino acid transport system permease protein